MAAASHNDPVPLFRPLRSVARRPHTNTHPLSLPARASSSSDSFSSIFTRGMGPSAADQADAAVDDGAPEESEFVCYGDRVCFLCEGQLLRSQRKFNLTTMIPSRSRASASPSLLARSRGRARRDAARESVPAPRCRAAHQSRSRVLHVPNDVMATLPTLQKSSMYKSMLIKKRVRPQSFTSLFTSRLRSLTFGSNNNGNNNNNNNNNNNSNANNGG
ncbi:hypothetical protein FI667_g17700, partial [Globisporangium splendens]